ncbi:hypothetical protein ACKLNR_011277 [Fusarium oxysporum f. sp. zingiberi]
MLHKPSDPHGFSTRREHRLTRHLELGLSAVKKHSHLTPDVTEDLYPTIVWLTTSTSSLRSISILALLDKRQYPRMAVK